MSSRCRASLALLAVSIVPAVLGLAGAAYLIGALVFGAAFIAAAVRFFFHRSNHTAMRLFMTSNLYLIAIMVLLVVSIRS